MKSYLLNRKQYVEIDDSDSDMLILTTGVPQGSILFPLLFIIYMNNVAHASKHFDFNIVNGNELCIQFKKNLSPGCPLAS